MSKNLKSNRIKESIDDVKNGINLIKGQANAIMLDEMISKETHQAITSNLESINLFIDGISTKLDKNKNISSKDLLKIKNFIEKLDKLDDSLEKYKDGYREDKKTVRMSDENIEKILAETVKYNHQKNNFLNSGSLNESDEVKNLDAKILINFRSLHELEDTSKLMNSKINFQKQKVEQFFHQSLGEMLVALPTYKQESKIGAFDQQNDTLIVSEPNIIVEKAISWSNIPTEQSAKKVGKLSLKMQQKLQTAVEERAAAPLRDLQGNELDLKAQLNKQPQTSALKKPKQLTPESFDTSVQNKAQESAPKNENSKAARGALNNFTKLKNDIQGITTQAKKQVEEYLEKNLSPTNLARLTKAKEDAIAIGKQFEGKVKELPKHAKQYTAGLKKKINDKLTR